jgi:multimeric flavodoxin WrbA
MRVLFVSGSRQAENRNSRGKTERCGESVLQGVLSVNEEVDRLFLPDIRIERCRQCNKDGWGICRTEGRCVIEDDFVMAVDKIRQADAVVFATPVYYGDLSESMRAFLDRLRRTATHAEDKYGLPEKYAIGLCIAGGGGGGSVSCALSLEKALRGCGFDVLDMVPIRRQNLRLKMDSLPLMGRWLTGMIEEQRQAKA